MRILIFHGYLLRGTGSNVYNRELLAALSHLGHEVDMLSQEPDPEPLPGVTYHRPEIGGVLPVYVADRYAGFDARPFPELTDEEVQAYVDRNVAAVRAVVADRRPDVALANHLVMGPAILRRALAGSGVPYAIKIHGSALEYTVKPYPRFLPWAREGAEGAAGILVGSRHTAESLWEALDDPNVVERTRLGPPGVDVRAFAPRAPDEAAVRLGALADRLAGAPPGPEDESSFARDPGAAGRALQHLGIGKGPLVTFVGKLIVSKGIDLLIAAWPLVLARSPSARLAVVGFGAWRSAADELVAALAAGDAPRARAIAEAGRAGEGGPRERLRHLLAFLDSDPGDAYWQAARALPGRLAFVGRLEHSELADLLPACEAMVVPSTFPESFGMVAAEAAACGALPVCARHSGLAEVTEALASALAPEVRSWLTFDVGPGAVRDVADRVIAWLDAPPDVREQTRTRLVDATRERYSWEGVASGVIAAAQGRLTELPIPRPLG